MFPTEMNMVALLKLGHEEKFIQCHHRPSLDYSVACTLPSCMQLQVCQITWSHCFGFLTDDDYYCFAKIWSLKIFFAKRAGYQICLPFSIYKVFYRAESVSWFTWWWQIFARYCSIAKTRIYALFTRSEKKDWQALCKEDTVNTCKTLYTFLHGLQSITAEGRWL